MLKLVQKNKKNFIKQHCMWLDEVKGKNINGNMNAALNSLNLINPKKYCRDRNYLNGSVTKLSAYIQHGLLTLNTIRNHAIDQVEYAKDIEKFIQELAWRDFWQNLYYARPDDLWRDIEPYKTGFKTEDYSDTLPNDIKNARTPNKVINMFINTLIQTGYLHNHARMYLASYIIHWKKIKWQVGAKWMFHFLIDGNLASNNFSWQWIASTFSHKPYIFNLKNVQKYVGLNEHTQDEDNIELNYDYETLTLKLFPKKESYL